MSENQELNSVVTSKKIDGSWQAVHLPSGKIAHGMTPDEAQAAMRDLLGMTQGGQFDEPLTSDRFSGLAKEMAEFLEGPVSEMLGFYSGYARLEAYEGGTLHIRLGGGCQGCPSSTLTLVNGVREHLVGKFGEEAVLDIVPVH